MAYSRPFVVALSLLASCGGEPPVVPAPFGMDARPSNRTCVAPARPVREAQAMVARVFPNLTFAAPVAMLQAPGDSSTWYVVERGGRVRKFPNQPDAMPAQVSTYIDLNAQPATAVNAGPGEAGLLGMAFHPQFATNRHVFLSWTAPLGPTNLRSTVQRFTDAGGALDVGSRAVILPSNDDTPNELDQPFENHNGGNIAFGPDGYLYFGLGDGGSSGDPRNNGQTLTAMLGKMLRVDVDNVPQGQRYGIPPANPYAQGGGRPEIFATGFRNPWRWSFDRETGDLWVGDVGQGDWEEIDRVVVGGNYGWRYREGAHCYNPRTDCPTAGLIDPVVEYAHANGRQSIVGGYVYRGSAIPSLRGTYLYGDTYSGEVFYVDYDTQGNPRHAVLTDTDVTIYSFAEDNDGELYLLGANGQLHQLVPAGPAPVDTFPQRLTDTGCVDPSDPKKPAPGLIPYGVNAPLWSDGAEKERWLGLPDGTTITVGADGDFEFPNGTVLMKTFSIGGKRVETRLFMRHADGEWAGYSYEWNDAETEATLLPGAKTRTVGGQTWGYPSGADCLTCHTEAAGRTLGPEVAQLNGDFAYRATGRLSNQLATLEHIGLFAQPLGEPATQPKLPDPAGTAPLDERARAYLHANCAGCHRPGGPGRGTADWRFQIPLAMTMTCDAMPLEGDLGITDARLLAPGDPARSLVTQRMRALDATRMPPLGTGVVHEAGVKLVEDWIGSLAACP